MEETATVFNTFDIIVLTVIGLSSLLAFVRGFLRETLSLVAWGAAGVAAWYGYAPAGEMLKPYMSSEKLALAVGAVGIFVLVLIVLSIVNFILVRAAHKANIGPLDRSLGFAFGLARGALIVSLAHLGFSLVFAREEMPEWFQHAKTARLVEMGSEVFASMAPDTMKELRALTENMGGAKPKKEEAATTHDDYFLEGIFMRESFSSLTKEEKEAMNKIIAVLPAMKTVSSSAELSDRRASQMLVNLSRSYKQLYAKQQALAAEPPVQQGDALVVRQIEEKQKLPEIPTELLSNVENKLMIIYMRSPETDAPKAASLKEEPGYNKQQVQELNRLIQSVN